MLSRLFWGLFHWEQMSQEFRGPGNVEVCLVKWRRLWDEKAVETFEKSFEKLKEAGFVKYSPYLYYD